MLLLRLHHQPHVFFRGQKVFLRVPHDFTTLSKDKCAILRPCFCGPFTILKHCHEVSLACVAGMGPPRPWTKEIEGVRKWEIKTKT